jgi:pimeloyl-ACP methyl ester carboxylesterase
VVVVGGRRVRIHAHRTPLRGPAVVLLHGLLSSGRQWRGTLSRLAARRLALWAPDLPGFGRSGLVRRPQRLVDYADALDAWAEARGLDRIALVGHSFGGMVALDWAARHPRRVASLGLLAPAVVPHGFRVPPPFARPMLGRLLLAVVSLPPIGLRFFRYVVDDVSAIPAADRASYAWGIRRCRALLGLGNFYEFADLPAVKAVRWPCGHSVMAERPADSDRFVCDVALAAAPS